MGRFEDRDTARAHDQIKKRSGNERRRKVRRSAPKNEITQARKEKRKEAKKQHERIEKTEREKATGNEMRRSSRQSKVMEKAPKL